MCRHLGRAAAIHACLVVLLVSVLASGCAAPPNKELADAQDALTTARAAGAERYAPDAYRDASDAYRLANDAVLAGDYRLALNHALESRERAEAAARESADVQARARADVQRSMIEVATLLAQAGSRIEDAERAGVPRRTIRAAQEAVAAVNDDVQEAGAAMHAEDYAGAEPLLAGVKSALEGVLAPLDEALAAQPQKQER
jgi:hypothetical protein